MAVLPNAWHDYYKLLLETFNQQKTAADSLNAILERLGQNVGTVESGTVETAYGAATLVPSGVVTSLASYAALGPTRVKTIEVSGTNIATYTVTVNNQVLNKKQTFYGYLDNDFDFSKGYPMNTGDTVVVKVVHEQASVGDFNAFILVLKDY